MTNINFEDVQGLVFSGYNKVMKFSSYYLLRIDDPHKVRSWLRTLADEQRITHGNHRGTKWCLNLAFSRSGFDKMELAIDSFEQAFQEGMNSERRSTVLGDQGENHPDHWQWGHADKSIDMLLMLFSKDEETHEECKNTEESAFMDGGIRLIDRLDASNAVKVDGGDFVKEHFGFADGVSDPVVEGFPKAAEKKAATNPQAPKIIPTGEFLLGYPNGYDGKITAIPSAGSLKNKFGLNGTYLVFRQLQQDVKGFWTFINNEAAAQGVDPEYLAAKFVGRWKSGAVVLPGEKQDTGQVNNTFDFRDDPDGTGCPFGSHIRRSNPRGTGLGETVDKSLVVANRHRLLRRGRSYGNFLDNPLDDGGNQNRGLFFICLNANIERQFEFVQHSWINNIKFNSLYDEDDPLIGSYGSGKPAFSRSFTIQDEPLRRRIYNFQQYVALIGGGYFFLPGINALRMLGEG